jgi:hypothetical protein
VGVNQNQNQKGREAVASLFFVPKPILRGLEKDLKGFEIFEKQYN